MLDVTPVGETTQDEAEQVRIELSKLPETELDMLRQQEVTVIVCRDNVTKYNSSYFEKDPTGWPPGATWKDVPGTYLAADREVVIATIEDTTGRWRIPKNGEKHSTHNLVLHETMHASDFVADRLRCNNLELKLARWEDRDKLQDYYRTWQDPEKHGEKFQIGLQETYAESAARFFGKDQNMAEDWPNLFAFWEEASLPIEPGKKETRGEERRKYQNNTPLPVGTARMLHDGSFELDLRTETEDWVVGHALIRITKDHPAYPQLLERARRRRRGGNGVKFMLAPFVADLQ